MLAYKISEILISAERENDELRREMLNAGQEKKDSGACAFPC